MILFGLLSDAETRMSKRRKISNQKEFSAEELPAASLPKANPTSASRVTRRGKISCITLPQEYALEKLVLGLITKPEQWTAATPACEWTGIKCDESGNIEEIRWAWKALKGSFDFEHIPATVVRFVARSSGISGNVNLENLPTGSRLHTLRLNNNALKGSLALTSLPQSIVAVDLSHNFLTGCISLVNLPPNLSELKLSFNDFSGRLTLTELPANIDSLHLNNNNFEGSVDLHNLPPRIGHLRLQDNKLLSGKVRVAKLPVALLDYLAGLWLGTKISLE